MHACMAEATPKMLRFRTTLDGKEPLADVWMRTVLSTRPSPSTTFRPPSLPRSPSTARRGGRRSLTTGTPPSCRTWTDASSTSWCWPPITWRCCFQDRIVDKVAEMIKGKMPEEIRASLGIVNDLNLEEKGINDKYPWALAKKEH